MTINELVIKNENDLTEKQIDFLNTHNNILTAGAVISNGLVNLAINLKKMKEDKLYLEAGYNSFEDYSERACNLKQRQAYNYIKVLDNLGEEFLHLNAQIGIAKLTLLTILNDEEKIELINEVKVEDVTVSELKIKIKELQEQNKAKDETIDKKNKIIDKNNKSISDLKKELNDIVQPKVVEKDSAETLSRLDELSNELVSSNKLIEDLRLEKERLLKKMDISNSDALVEFKILFDNLQSLINRLRLVLGVVPDDKKLGCTNALKKVGVELC